MQQLGMFLKEVKTSKATSERASYLEDFLTEINKERFNTKYPPLTARGLAIKLSHVPTNELMEFWNKCMRYKKEKGSFSRAFFGCLKIK